MKLFITGGNGQLAFELMRISEERKVLYVAPTKNQFDITQESQVTKILTACQPDFVINTAAYTKVDLAESNPQAAFAANRDGARNLSMVCAKLNCPLVHISTDYVFDGNTHTPYAETDRPRPINTYGLSKWEGEQAIVAQHEKHLILRVSAVFGSHGHNFVKSIIRLANKRDSLRIVADQITNPTPAKSIAEAIFQMIDHFQPGTYHYCGDESVSWFEFTQRILHKMGISIPIHAITTAEYPLPAKRPLYSVLDCAKLESTFGISKPHWESELAHVIKTLSTA